MEGKEQTVFRSIPELNETLFTPLIERPISYKCLGTLQEFVYLAINFFFFSKLKCSC